MTDSDLIHEWCRSMKARNFSKGTLTGYRRTTMQFIRWCHTEQLTLARVTHTDIIRWLDSLDHGSRTRYAYTSIIGTLYGWLLREEIVERDPTVRVERPRLGRYLPRPADPAAVARALVDAEPRVVAMIALGAFAGLRRFEIPALRVEDLLLHRKPPLVLVHGKGNKERLVPLHDDVIAALRAHGIPKTGWIFPSPTTRRGLSPNYVGKLMTEPFEHLDGHVTPHMLRHLFGTQCYEDSDGDLRLVQELMGHASPTSTAIYTAFSRPKAERVVRNLFAPRNDDEAA